MRFPTLVNIDMQETPNPDARRYMVDIAVQDGSQGRSFRGGDDGGEPLVEELFRVFGVESVLLLPNSVTVNKATEAAWENVEPSIREAIERWSGR